MRFFNTAGPCDARLHYMLPPEDRLPETRRLIERGQYFVVHAPRQSGKTTTLRALARGLTAAGQYAALHTTCESAETAGDDFEVAQRRMLHVIAEDARSTLPAECQPPDPWPEAPAMDFLGAGLSSWANRCPRRLVLILDEIDALKGSSLMSVLRQLRAAYPDRPERAPWSAILCGLRDVRDDAFNIKVAALPLADFAMADVRALYAQHAEEGGLPFSEAAVTRAFELSEGQPWLTNAIAAEIVDHLGLPAGTTVDAPHVDLAAERLIKARATHLDSLVAPLHEPRVHRVIEPLIAGTFVADVNGTCGDDVDYVRGLGLLHRDAPLRIANPIYREVIVRGLAGDVEGRIPALPRDCIRGDGALDLRALLQGFAAFWREHGDVLAGALLYHEVAPQLVLMAYLHRIVNASGLIEREYGVGRGRIDLLIRWPVADAPGPRRWQREAIELKVWAPGRPDPLEKGLAQLDEYLTRLGLDRGALVLFDRRAEAPPITERTRLDAAQTPSGHSVTVLRA